MLRLFVDSARCTGCLNCETVCSLVKAKSHNKFASLIRVNLDLFSGNHTHIFCRQCEEAECQRVCSANAIYRDEVTGALKINIEACLQCGICVDACSYSAMFWDEQNNYPFKCDLCSGKPACVEACSFDVIEFRKE